MEKITKITYFDFDGTSVKTQMPDSGKIIWENVTGNVWPHIGWWSKPESLDIEVFEHPVNPLVKEANDIHNGCDETLTVMLTGRRKHLATLVEDLLDKYEYKFDRHQYNYGGSTEQNKIDQMNNALEEFKNVKTITFFDDRLEHLPIFKDYLTSLVDNGRLDTFNLYHVDGQGEINVY